MKAKTKSFLSFSWTIKIKTIRSNTSVLVAVIYLLLPTSAITQSVQTVPLINQTTPLAVPLQPTLNSIQNPLFSPFQMGPGSLTTMGGVDPNFVFLPEDGPTQWDNAPAACMPDLLRFNLNYMAGKTPDGGFPKRDAELRQRYMPQAHFYKTGEPMCHGIGDEKKSWPLGSSNGQKGNVGREKIKALIHAHYTPSPSGMKGRVPQALEVEATAIADFDMIYDIMIKKHHDIVRAQGSQDVKALDLSKDAEELLKNPQKLATKIAALHELFANMGIVCTPSITEGFNIINQNRPRGVMNFPSPGFLSAGQSFNRAYEAEVAPFLADMRRAYKSIQACPEDIKGELMNIYLPGMAYTVAATKTPLDDTNFDTNLMSRFSSVLNDLVKKATDKNRDLTRDLSAFELGSLPLSSNTNRSPGTDASSGPVTDGPRDVIEPENQNTPGGTHFH